MREKLQKVLPILLFGFLLVVGLLVRGVVIGSYENKLAASNQQVVDISNQRDTNLNSQDSEKQAVLDKVTGLDLNRQKQDDEKAAEVFKSIFTWNSYKTYNDVKAKMLNEYEMNEGVVKRLMPEVPEIVSEGNKKINEIDANKLSMNYVNLQSYVVKIFGTDYSYITEVTVESSDRTGNKASGKVLMSYDVAMNGQISNMNGFTLAR